ncbi:MAG: hypothetical protein AB1705_01570 [Verrucomicrobiota bacterium]
MKVANFALGLALACVLAPVTVRADKVVLVAGGGTKAANRVAATQAQLKEPFGVAFDSKGNTFIVEMATGQRLLNMERRGLIFTYAGTGQKGSSGDGGPAREATFDGVHNLAIAPNDAIYLADTWNCRIRKIDVKTGIITTVAGTGEKGYGGDGGPATEAKLGGIYCATLDKKGEKLYLADLHNFRIRVLDIKTGIITTVAGNGKKGVPKDGEKAVDQPLADPRAVAVDGKGNIYILERGGHALRVVDAQGKIRTVVNASGTKGADGDGGDALKATMNGPKHLCIDKDDSVIIADAENHLIRRYQPKDGKIVRVAGTGKKGAAGIGGPPEQVELNRPHGVTIHPASGELYITDSYNNRILKITK